MVLDEEEVRIATKATLSARSHLYRLKGIAEIKDFSKEDIERARELISEIESSSCTIEVFALNMNGINPFLIDGATDVLYCCSELKSILEVNYPMRERDFSAVVCKMVDIVDRSFFLM